MVGRRHGSSGLKAAMIEKNQEERKTMDLTSRQTLALWILFFTGQEPTMTEFTKNLGAGPKLKGTTERQQLVDAGLIALERRGRATHVVLTDKAWARAIDYLDAPVTRSKFAADALGPLLRQLQMYLRRSGVSLAELLSGDEASSEPDDAAEQTVEEELNEQRLREAYSEISGGKWNIRVRLADLRDQLDGVPRERLDALLLQMEREGKLVLYPLDYRPDIRPEDEQAAIDIGGYKNHIVYMEGRP